MYYLEDLQDLTYEQLLDYHYELAAKRADMLEEAEEWGKHYQALKMLMSELLTDAEYKLLFGENLMTVKH